MKLVIAIVGGLMLAGCVQVRGTGERGMTDAEIEAKDDGVCRSFGAVKGTQAYIDCRLRLRSTRSSEDSGRRLRSAIIDQ